MRLPVMPPVAPMLAKPVSQIPAGCLYEPKWDGFRAIIFRDGDQVEIGSRNGRPLARYFPEVVAAVKRSFPRRCVVDGEIVIVNPDTGGLDFWALQQRLHPAPSRVHLLAGTTPASFIGFDLLALGEVDHMPRPFRQRRASVERVLAPAEPPIHLTPITDDQREAERWFNQFEGAGLDGIVAKDANGRYQPDMRVMYKVKHQRTADCVVAGYRVHKSNPRSVGSLLLGLYDHNNTAPVEWASLFAGLTPVGVAGAFTAAQRGQLFAELQPLVIDITEHPWHPMILENANRPRSGQGSRWNPGKDLSFVPLLPQRVVEVRYDHIDGGRFRHPVQFLRWRPDREPTSCGFAQLETPASFDVAQILAQ